MNLVNLTPHTIKVVSPYGEAIFEPSGRIARVEMDEYRDCPLIDGDCGEFPTIKRVVSGVFLPLEDDEIGIVSSMVLAATNSSYVVAPDTGPTAIRENGQIVAVTRFVRN
jgi:hypothetical protein